MQLTATIFISFFVSWIWIDYLRRIDLFEREKPWHLALLFSAGALFPLLVDPLHQYIIRPLGIELTGNVVNDFLYHLIVVGLVEEVIKFLPLGLILLFNRKLLNEPIDYLVFICISALGFAFHENILYIQRYGFDVILSRAVLSVPSHMFDSALFIYGVIAYTYKKGAYRYYHIFLSMFLGVVSHGFYDFFLSFPALPFGPLVTIIYFFITISLFATVCGNCMNMSPHYHPKKVIDTEKLTYLMFTYYIALFLGMVAYIGISSDMEQMTHVYLRFVLLRFFILVILILRLCRFKIIPGRWVPLRFEFPFRVYYTSGRRKGIRIDAGIRQLNTALAGQQQGIIVA